MDKYIIVNETYNSVLCKDKYSSRRYRQDRNNIDKHCVIVQTTRGRAEQERDYLNNNYNKGWEIQKVEPIVFYDNAEDREKYLNENETLNKEEIKKIEKETAEKIYSFAMNFYDGSEQFELFLLKFREQFGVEIGEDQK